MIKRVFEWRDENDRGYPPGWVPAWIKSDDFDPSWGLGVAHDAIEHRASDTGQWHQELMAFGAMKFTRIDTGYFGTGDGAELRLGKELTGLWLDSGKPSIAPMPARRRCQFDRYDLPHDMTESTRLLTDGFLDGFDEYDLDKEGFSQDEIVDMGYWFTVGYIQARRRYASKDYNVLCCFEQILSEVDKRSKRGDFITGDRMTVTADINSARVRVWTYHDRY